MFVCVCRGLPHAVLRVVPTASVDVAVVRGGVDQGDALVCIGVAMYMCSHVLYVCILWPTLIQNRLFDRSFPRCSQNLSMVVPPPLLIYFAIRIPGP